MELANVLLMLFVVFVLAKLSSLVVKKFGIPGLVGEIIIGVLLSNVIIGDQSIAGYLDLIYDVDSGYESDGYTILHTLAELGVMFLLFSVGLETRVKDLMSVGKAAFLVALLGVIVPFILGYAYIMYMSGDANIYHALFLGAAMVATSVGITARVIKDMKLTDARESRIIIGAAVIDDILGMIVLAIVSGMAKSGGIDFVEIIKISVMALVFVVAILLFAGICVPKIYNWRKARIERKFAENKNYLPMRYSMLAVAIACCIGFGYLAEYIGLASIIGSFLAGMIFAEYVFEWKLEEKIEGINTLLVSFFFVYVGIQVDLSSVDQAVIITTVVVIVLALIGKFIGCSLGAKIGDKSLDKGSLSIIGIGMMPRGEVGIIVATIGLGIYIASEHCYAISSELYTTVVLMSVVTTIIAPPLLSMAFRKKYKSDYEIMPEDQL